MDKILPQLSMKRLLVICLLACCGLSGKVFGQSYTYTNGGLTLEITVYNPCGSPTPDNGYMDIKAVAAGGGIATIVFLDAPGFSLDISGVNVNVGSTYRYNAPSNSLPDGSYNYIFRDQTGSQIISYSDPVTYPPIVLTDLQPVSLSQDILQNNTVCTNPTTGQIQSSISGGSKILTGGGKLNYEWNSPNGLAGLPLTGTTDGTTPLNLASLLGVPGLPGGTYTLKVTDVYSACAEVQRSFTITDPSPVIQTVTTATPNNICAGDNITITMAGSENGVNYTIMRNGVATSNSFVGTGSAPFVMTFPSTGFSDNDVLQVRASNGFCTPTTMLNSVLLRINPLPAITGAALADVCQGDNDILDRLDLSAALGYEHRFKATVPVSRNLQLTFA